MLIHKKYLNRDENQIEFFNVKLIKLNWRMKLNYCKLDGLDWITKRLML